MIDRIAIWMIATGMILLARGIAQRQGKTSRQVINQMAVAMRRHISEGGPWAK